MAATSSIEDLLLLFEQNWFIKNIIFPKNPDQENPEKSQKQQKLFRNSSQFLVRSFSDQSLRFSGDEFSSKGNVSPDSVLPATQKRLQTIISGKEWEEFEEKTQREKQGRQNRVRENLSCAEMEMGTQTGTGTGSENDSFQKYQGRFRCGDVPKYQNGDVLGTGYDNCLELPCIIGENPETITGERKQRRNRREKRGKSKSLSELEFEELKGFMDLGFVFSEEDKDSSLGAIIPGLQRLGKKQGNMSDFDHDDCEDVNGRISRPYLSEAWEMLDQKKEEVNNPLMNWRIPSNLISNEIDMKNHLRFWAHTVASTVR